MIRARTHFGASGCDPSQTNSCVQSPDIPSVTVTAPRLPPGGSYGSFTTIPGELFPGMPNSPFLAGGEHAPSFVPYVPLIRPPVHQGTPTPPRYVPEPIVRGPPFVGTPMAEPPPPADLPGLGLAPFLQGLALFAFPSELAPSYLDESQLNPARSSEFGPPEIDRFGGLRNPFDIISDLYHALTDNLKPTPQPQHEYGFATGLGANAEGLSYFVPSLIPRAIELPEVVVTGRPAPAAHPFPLGDPFAPPAESPGDEGLRIGEGFAKPKAPPRPETPVKPAKPGQVAHPETPFQFKPFDPFKPEPEPQPQPEKIGQPDEVIVGQARKPTPNDCGCTPPTDKKKKKEEDKKREPRAICYQGTYIERAKGLLKYRRKQIPCR